MSQLKRLARMAFSFIQFNKALIRWPGLFIKYSIKNISEYGNDPTFKANIESMPNWIPINIRIISCTVKIAWHIANIDFTVGLEGMYRFSMMQKAVNDIVISLINNNMLSDDLHEEFIAYEEMTKSGNTTGTGRVWDFYDDAFNGLIFTRPYSSVLEVLLNCNFITRSIYDKYTPETNRLDRILREHDAVMYSGSNSEALLKNYDDSYFKARLFKDDSISLKQLEELQSKK